MDTDNQNPAFQITPLGDVPRRHAAACPDKIAMSFRGRETTYCEFDKNASRMANALLQGGLTQQDRITYLGKNSDRCFELIFGAAKAGAVFAALNWRLAAPEVAAVLEDTRPSIIFAEAEFIALAESALEGFEGDITRVVLGGVGDADGDGDGDADGDGWISFDDWWKDASDTDPKIEVDLDDVAIQMYTSGTTGRPKGVQLTHRNLGVVERFQEQVGDWALTADDEIYAVYAPVYHVTGTAWGIMGLRAAARLVIIPEFDMDQILDAFEQERVTRALFVPAMFLMLLHHPRGMTADYSSLRLVYYGASPIPLGLLRKSLAVLGCPFVQVYGMTETAGMGTYLPPADQHPEGGPKMQSCGLPWPEVEIRIIGEDGNELPVGEIGEVFLKTETLMKGYWQRQEATDEVMEDGWYRTGDAGSLDADGYLYICDRVKDMIITGGENVYPAEVENVFHDHPDVVDAGVIGIPSEAWGEDIKAFVMLKPGSEETEESLIAYVRERIASYKCPRSIDIVPMLPRNATGKILKTELRAPYWEGHERGVV